MTGNTNIRQILWTLAFLTVLVWSGIAPKERFTWFLEVAPAVAGAAVLWATRRRFPLTPLTYVLVLLHAIILMVGGRYTYAEVPLFDWIRDVLGTSGTTTTSLATSRRASSRPSSRGNC
jgi:putative membrane protein